MFFMQPRKESQIVRKFLLNNFLLVALLLSACGLIVQPPPATPTPLPTATFTPTPQPAECPLGTWEAQDFSSVLQIILTNALSQASTVSEVSSTGSLRFTLNQDGTLIGAADRFKVQTKVNLSFLPLNVEVDMNGTASADYSLDKANQTISYSNFDPGDLTINTSANGISMDQQIDLNGLMLGAENGTTTTQYQCQGDTLLISLPIEQAQGQVIVLKRTN
jgi:hypothetical protein